MEQILQQISNDQTASSLLILVNKNIEQRGFINMTEDKLLKDAHVSFTTLLLNIFNSINAELFNVSRTQLNHFHRFYSLFITHQNNSILSDDMVRIIRDITEIQQNEKEIILKHLNALDTFDLNNLSIGWYYNALILIDIYIYWKEYPDKTTIETDLDNKLRELGLPTCMNNGMKDVFNAVINANTEQTIKLAEFLANYSY